VRRWYWLNQTYLLTIKIHSTDYISPPEITTTRRIEMHTPMLLLLFCVQIFKKLFFLLLVLSGMHCIDVAYCYGCCTQHMCRVCVGHMGELCKNIWTDWHDVWGPTHRSKVPSIRWGSRSTMGRGTLRKTCADPPLCTYTQMHFCPLFTCHHMADEFIRRCKRAAVMQKYSEHLLLL